MTTGQIIFIVLFSSLGFCGCVCGCVIFYDEFFLNDDDEYILQNLAQKVPNQHHIWEFRIPKNGGIMTNKSVDNTESELNLAFNDIYKNNNRV